MSSWSNQLELIPRHAEPEESEPAREPRANGRPFRDITGLRSGRLVAIEPTEERCGSEVVWQARCDCGNTLLVVGRSLARGLTSSCGCLRLRGNRKNGIGTGKRGRRGGQGAAHGLYLSYRQSAKTRGIGWHLSPQKFLELTECACTYCGAPPSQEFGGRDDTYLYNGLDRVDNAGPYSVDNCVPCCGPCNVAKGTMSVEEFREHIRRIYHHWAA